MKVIYIGRQVVNSYLDLTKDNVYETVETNNFENAYLIINDSGIFRFYNKNIFITLQESRRLKLKKLGI
jgi:threonyl-tRNA synthetase